MKLARQGEPWAEEEARQYQDGNIMKAKHVWHSIQNFLDEEAARFPQRRISTLRRICAQHWGFSPAEFRKRFPRFDAYYKREKELQGESLMRGLARRLESDRSSRVEGKIPAPHPKPPWTP